jgi:hypothetical protein
MGEMKRIEHLVPGTQPQDEGILAHLRWPIPAGVAEAYVAAYTEPGEQVLVAYCQGSTVVREILSGGRQPLALNFDPLLVLLVRTELSPPPARELTAAVARLGDSLKQGIPLHQYLTELYTTSCPACSRPAVVDYFLWEREPVQPIAKILRCPACKWNGQTAVEMEDRERLEGISARGMHYHYILDRVAPSPQGDALRSRLEALLELYSPRNLYALAELTLKIESLFPEGPLSRALKALLLDCLDRCSSLAPLPGSTARRRRLVRPARFPEYNVWRAFEAALGRLQASAGKPLPGLAESLESLAPPGKGGGAWVGQALVRDLSRRLPPRSLRLILTSPPPLDPTVWSLSYLWGAWLWGAEAAAPLRPLLRQRTADPEWYARVMAGSLGILVDLLSDDGRLVFVLTDQRRSVLEALVLAASRARLAVTSLVQRGTDYRLELAPAFPELEAFPKSSAILPQPAAVPREALDTEIRQAAIESVAETIRARGEPVPWSVLHAAIQRRLAEADSQRPISLLARVSDLEGGGPSPLDEVAEQVGVALTDAAFVRLVADELHQELWWLAEPGELASPLCDRVEAAVYQVLQDALALTEVDLVARVYAHFPGILTPDAQLVGACLQSYGREPAPGYWQLREEDVAHARLAEQETVVQHLLDLGQRLGYRAERQAPFDVAWFEGERARAVFVVRWQAVVSEALALSDRAAGTQPYMVIPGGRAALVSHKLAHNPIWQEVVDRDGWWFIKYRHVRQLVGQPEVDEYSLRTIVGLDPIVERETMQLPLF